jgi:hypothetical protein
MDRHERHDHHGSQKLLIYAVPSMTMNMTTV